MAFVDNYTTADKQKLEPEKEKGKTIISVDTYAQTEGFIQAINHLAYIMSKKR